MNFMIVTDTFPPDINGVARTLLILAQGLIHRGHRVNIVTTVTGEQNPPSLEVTRVRSLPVPGYESIRMGLASRKAMEREIKKHQPDAMYVAVETPMGLSAIRGAARAGVGVVSGFHTNFHTYTTSYKLRLLGDLAARYLRWIHNRTRRTLAPSEGTADQLRKLGVNNVGVLGRGVDAELFHPSRRDPALRKEWGADDSTPVALFVSRIAAEKNLPLAVRAFERLAQLNPGVRCIFVGDGPKSKWLRETYPQFVHAGLRTGEDLARHYASADLFVFPSLSETFGNVLIEALASGLVTVSFDYAAARQVVRQGENGFVAAFGDEDAYLRVTSEALQHWNDATLRQAARDAARTLSWSAIVDLFEHELKQAAAAGTASQKLAAPFP